VSVYRQGYCTLLAHFVLIITSGSRFKFFFENQRTCVLEFWEIFKIKEPLGPGLLNFLRIKEASSKNWQFS
jgi:hypothetical protein